MESDPVTGKLLSRFGKTKVCEFTLTVNFLKSKYRSIISDENFTSELKCTVNLKYTPDLKNLITNSYMDHMLK